jgi:hypothetical protein
MVCLTVLGLLDLGQAAVYETQNQLKISSTSESNCLLLMISPQKCTQKYNLKP